MDSIQIRNVRTLEDSQTDDDSSLGSDSDSLGSSLVIDEESETMSEPSLPTTPVRMEKKKVYPKPPLSYSILAGLAFKNCRFGKVPVANVYSFIIKHFPFYQNAASGWKNSIRHNLSLNKCFMRVDPEPTSETVAKSRKGMMWTLTPERIALMEAATVRAVHADRAGVLAAMRFPEDLGRMLAGRSCRGNGKLDEDTLDEESEDDDAPDVEPEKTFIFTQFKDGVLPLVTLYSKTPGLHSRYSNRYPVVP